MQSSKAFTATRELDYATSIGGKWKRKDIQFCRFPAYDLTYAHYCKFPSWGLQVSPLSLGAKHPFPSSSIPILSYPKSAVCPCSSSADISFINILASIFNIFTTNAIPFDVNPSRPSNKNTQKPYPSHHQLIPMLAAFTVVQLLPFVLVYCIEECSPLVLFSWWRNKISWDQLNKLDRRMRNPLCWRPLFAAATHRSTRSACVVPSLQFVHLYNHQSPLSIRQLQPPPIGSWCLLFRFSFWRWINVWFTLKDKRKGSVLVHELLHCEMMPCITERLPVFDHGKSVYLYSLFLLKTIRTQIKKNKWQNTLNYQQNKHSKSIVIAHTYSKPIIYTIYM